MTTTGTYYVDDDPALLRLVADLRKQSWFALDTEFEREKTYYARLCLVQIATPDWVACIDPHALDNFDALREVMLDTSVLKVLHACSQDCEIFYQRWGAVPAPIFDTQVAAPLLGYTDQLGYAALVENMLGVHLPKSHTRTDWCQRPLSDAQLRYAEDDVRYLAALYPQLRDALLRRERLHWLTDDFAELSEPAKYANPPTDAWRRLRRLDRLANTQLATVQALAEWRETTAQARNLPRAWLLRDAALLDLARAAPTDTAELRAVENLHPRLVSRHGDTLLDLIADASERPPRGLPESPSAPLTAGESAELAKLREQVQEQASHLEIDPDLLASRKKLVRLVRGEPVSDVFKGWRLAALAGALR
ncbi:MAG: ribonuclease D [Gammaproteobacteria bacterium]|nr:ribonuclease D [Gammaproteobacteria bacterium]